MVKLRERIAAGDTICASSLGMIAKPMEIESHAYARYGLERDFEPQSIDRVLCWNLVGCENCVYRDMGRGIVAPLLWDDDDI